MKTISESSQEYTTKDSLYIIDGEYVDKTIEDAFVAGVEFAQRWISVEEEMPENNGNVLVKTKYGSISVAFYDVNYKDWCSVEQRGVAIIGVSHWRPIEHK